MICTTGTDKDKGRWLLATFAGVYAGVYTSHWLVYTPEYSTAGLGQKAGGPFCPAAGPSYPTFPYQALTTLFLDKISTKSYDNACCAYCLYFNEKCCKSLKKT